MNIVRDFHFNSNAHFIEIEKDGFIDFFKMYNDDGVASIDSFGENGTHLDATELAEVNSEAQTYFKDLLNRLAHSSWQLDDQFIYIKLEACGDDTDDQYFEIGFNYETCEIDSLKQFKKISKRNIEISCIFEKSDLPPMVTKYVTELNNSDN